MATPDTSGLTSSSQVFTTYTLPQIRAVHKSLHVQIDEKAARLRTQVGNSYRELLGTADTIVQMRQDMSDVQNILGRMGGKCGRTVVGGKVAGLGKFRGQEEIGTEMGLVARVKLLEACGTAVGRLLKAAREGRGDRLVLAAKVLVLSRLLVTSFGDLQGLKPEIRAPIEAAKKSVGGLRNKLRRGIEKVLNKVGDDVHQGDIMKALCAYSLASSSGAKDVLWYFLNVRKEAMAFEFDAEEHERDNGTHNVLKGLDLYTRTLLDVQAFVPTRFSEALAGLKKKPLLADDSLQKLEGLRLDIYERWCGDEIQYFTPFIRHDDLDGKQAKDMLTKWAKEGGETLLEGLEKMLERMPEFKAIVGLRTSVLQHWIRDGGKARGFDPSVMLDGLRAAINSRLLSVLDTKVAKLRLVGSEVAATFEAWQRGVSDTYNSLWDEEMLDMDVSNGSAQVTHDVLSRLHGQNHAVARAVTSYESWYHLIDDVGEVVSQLRRQRWDNDVDEIEDEETIEVRQKLLSRDDPQKIDAQLHRTLEQAYRNLNGQLGKLWQVQRDGPNNGQIAMYLLRILRSIRTKLPNLESTSSFGLENVPSLYEKLVAHVSIAPLQEFTSTSLTRKRVNGRGLWEGEPALPTQPSPGTFKLLRNLVMSMADAGLDLWSPAAVLALKKAFGIQLSDAWRAKLNQAEESKEVEVQVETADDKDVKDEAGTGDETSTEVDVVEAESPKAETVEPADADPQRDLLIQWLYDIHLLQVCLGPEHKSNESLKSLADEVFEQVGLQDEARERMVKTSQEYWKRTSLLFGLLA
ncbi:hypothetical protein BJ170DRAFT_348784 [Xylariales sp. AK1849]|nr:hypothetical protein BJ170DRAFT_348784 [Xylariales sp. AK1849]